MLFLEGLVGYFLFFYFFFNVFFWGGVLGFFVETNKVNKEHYFIRQNNTIYTFSIKICFGCMGVV